MSWEIAETNTHQDHVIAHVVGATPLGHFIWDETAYILLDIGFIWNIYLDMEMGLLPQAVAMAELDADEVIKNQFRADLEMMEAGEGLGPIQSVEVFESEDRRRLVLVCDERKLIVETEINHRLTRIFTDL